MKWILTFITLMLFWIGTTRAAEVTDKRVSELIEENIRLRAELEKARQIQHHHLHVIKILYCIPQRTQNLLALDQIQFDKDQRIDLRPMAKAELDAGRIVFLSAGGFPHPAFKDFQNLMQEEYGAVYVDFGLGCITDPLVRKSVEEHNAVVEEFLRKKHPGFDRQKQFEAFLDEWEKKQKPPTREGR